MAIALSVICTVRDELNKPSTFAIKVPTGFSLAQYAEFGTQMGTIVDAVLAGRLDSAELCFGADLSGLTSNSIDSECDIEEVGYFSFATAANRKVVVNVPTLDESLVVAGSDELDAAKPAVAAIESMMLDGLAVTGGTIIPCDVAEDDITALVTAREGFRP